MGRIVSFNMDTDRRTGRYDVFVSFEERRLGEEIYEAMKKDPEIARMCRLRGIERRRLYSNDYIQRAAASLSRVAEA